MRFRGFTQTIDRFDENQGLQETGVGIYYKEDFNNWADLKRRIKERFMSRRRREQMEADARAAEEKALREADSLERSGENEYIYSRLSEDSAPASPAATAAKSDSVAAWALPDSLGGRLTVLEPMDSLRRTNKLRREQEVQEREQK